MLWEQGVAGPNPVAPTILNNTKLSFVLLYRDGVVIFSLAEYRSGMVALLTKDQICGDTALDVIQKFGALAAPTDLAVLLGGMMSTTQRTNDGALTAYAWTASPSDIPWNNGVYGLGHTPGSFAPTLRTPAIRPVLLSSEAPKMRLQRSVKSLFGAVVLKYGEYPQTAVDVRLGCELEILLKHDRLAKTGKSYTFDSADVMGYLRGLKAKQYPEYEYKGKKYIRVLSRPADDDSRLSSGRNVLDDRPYWVKVEPIEWLVDPKGLWVAKKCLIAGIQFDKQDRYEGDFSKTLMQDYLNTYFAKEIKPSVLHQRWALFNRKLALR